MVNKTNLIIRSNIKQSYRQLVAVFFLMILTSILLNTVFVLKIDYNRNFERDCEKLNANDFRIAYIGTSDMNYKQLFSGYLSSDKRIKDFEIDEVYMQEGDAEYADGSVGSLIVLEKYSTAVNKRIDRYEILDEDINISDGVYAGYLFETAGMKIGDQCAVSVGSDSFDFTVKGFYNNPMVGTVNCGAISYILDDRLYDDLTAEKPFCCLVKVQCVDQSKVTEVYNDTVFAASFLQLDGYIARSAFSEEITTSRYTNSNIFRIILIIASVTMALILLAIIAIVMSNYVKENIRAFGTLKSIGYTSKNLIFPLLVEVGLLCLFASLIGVGISYTIFPIINRALESQSGIPYEVRFLFLPCVITVFICEITSLLSTFLSVYKIRRISSYNAIRDAKDRTDKLPDLLNLEKTKLNINLSIGLDAAIRNVSRSVILFFAFAGVSFLLCFSLYIYQNFIVDNTDVVNVICGESPNYIVSVNKESENDLTEYLSNNDKVENYYLFDLKDQSPIGKPVINFIGIEKDGYVTTLDYLIVDGTFPQNDHEMTVNKLYAIKNDIALNDELKFTTENGEVAYKVVGFNQGAPRSGTEGYILKEGLEKINVFDSITYYVFLSDVGYEEDFKADIMENCPVIYLLNERLTVSSMVDMYMLILYILAVVLCVVSAVIVVLVLYVLLSLLLGNKRREHGILKAIGFTTGDIVIQTETGVLPFGILGSAAGLLCSKDSVRSIVSTALHSIGIFDFGESLKLPYLAIVFAVLTLLSVVLIALLCRPISKISTHELFNRE